MIKINNKLVKKFLKDAHLMGDDLKIEYLEDKVILTDKFGDSLEIKVENEIVVFKLDNHIKKYKVNKLTNAWELVESR